MHIRTSSVAGRNSHEAEVPTVYCKTVPLELAASGPQINEVYVAEFKRSYL